MKRKIHVIGNWKMNHTVQTSADYWEEMDGEVTSDSVAYGLAVPHVLISEALDSCPGHAEIYAQNCHQEESGAYTGETSAAMLASLGVAGVVLGHSERRQYFSESDELIRQKILKAREHNLSVIYCCGEPLDIRKDEKHKSYVKEQLTNSLRGMDRSEMKHITIAYEPIWAIGTGETATAEQAEEMCGFIRQWLSEEYDQDLADKTIILYGGSVKPANCEELFSMTNVDGGLVGGASLKAESFMQLIEKSSDL